MNLTEMLRGEREEIPFGEAPPSQRRVAGEENAPRARQGAPVELYPGDLIGQPSRRGAQIEEARRGFREKGALAATGIEDAIAGMSDRPTNERPRHGAGSIVGTEESSSFGLHPAHSSAEMGGILKR